MNEPKGEGRELQLTNFHVRSIWNNYCQGDFFLGYFSPISNMIEKTRLSWIGLSFLLTTTVGDHNFSHNNEQIEHRMTDKIQARSSDPWPGLLIVKEYFWPRKQFLRGLNSGFFSATFPGILPLFWGFCQVSGDFVDDIQTFELIKYMTKFHRFKTEYQI